MNNSTHINLSRIYLLLGYIVLLQDSLIPDVYFLRLIFGFTFLGISIYYWLYANVAYKLPIFLKATNLLLILFTIYGLILWFSGDVLVVLNSGHRVSNATFLLSCYNSLLPIFAFYTFSIKEEFTIKRVKKIIKILFWISVINYFVARIVYSHAPGGSLDEFTNNASYSCVALLPLLLVFREDKKAFFFYLTVLTALIVLSLKRGAILISAIIIFLLIIFSLGGQIKSNKFTTIIVIVGLLVIGYFSISLFISNNYFVQERIEQTMEGNTSGRDLLYEDIFLYLSNIRNVDMHRFIWGGGAWYTLKVTINYAHSDWLEIAVDEGLVGVIIYLWFWIALVINIIKIRNNLLSRRIVLMFFIFYFIKSIMSMTYSEMGFVAGLGIGYFIGEATPLELKRKNT